MKQEWHIFTGNGEPHQTVFPPPPPWRDFGARGVVPLPVSPSAVPDPDDTYWKRARDYCTPASILDAVNAALILRRPLLVTGKPGTGKSSLIYRIAYELALGPVLVWPVNSRSSLREGLYDYDAIARLQESQLRGKDPQADPVSADIGNFITLRALGTALLPQDSARALLIDELDKADPDLPNDLLNIFEEGWFEIPELQRHKIENVSVRITNPLARTRQKSAMAEVRNGRVQCSAFPFIVMTSNGEREFPPAFLRRCIRLELPEPNEDQLTASVRAHLGERVAKQAAARIGEFAGGMSGAMATDQLLNSLFITHALNGGLDDAAVASQVDGVITKVLM